MPPLGLPPRDPDAALDAIARADAVELFVARVRERDAGFRLVDESAGLVATVCRRLDGVPLALELAAARVHALGLAETAARLDDVFRLLTRGSRTAVERHHTLRAAIDWSEQLLEQRERLLFRRLGVFPGTFDLEAVIAVGSGPDLAAADVADVLHRLVDKSLVVAHPMPGGGMRYSLMEVIRQYARERLLAADGSTAMSLNNLAVSRLLSGRAAQALVDVERAVAIARPMPAKPPWVTLAADLLHTYGAVLLGLGRVSEARSQFVRSLGLAAERGGQHGAMMPLLGLACAAAADDRPATCLTFLGAARRSAATSGSRMRSHCTPHEEAEKSSWAALGPEGAERAWAKGLRMDLPAVLAYAEGHRWQGPARPLTLRKAEIVRLVAAGLPNKEIARRLSISERTVDAHLEQVRNRLGLHNRAQIAAWAVARGVVER